MSPPKSRIRKWLALPAQEKRLLLWGLAYTLKNALFVFAYPSASKAKRILRPPHVKNQSGYNACPLLSIRSVERLTNNLRPRPNCLVQALTLQDLLVRNGQPAGIRFVARKSGQKTFEFHAVVTLNNRPVYGDHGHWENAAHLKRPDEATT